MKKEKRIEKRNVGPRNLDHHSSGFLGKKRKRISSKSATNLRLDGGDSNEKGNDSGCGIEIRKGVSFL